MFKNIALAALASTGIAAAAVGSELPNPPPPPFATNVPYAFRSGDFQNDNARTFPVTSHIVQVEGAPSIRVFFREVDVDAGSYLLATSLTDGYQHAMTASELAKWDYSSVFFNGDAVRLDLYLAPGERGSFEIDHLLVGLPGVPVPETICGNDDRVPASDNRSVRMLNSAGTGACSGWLASTDSCVISAGHCFPTYSSMGEVNVPPSTSSGALQHPPPQDQFPVDSASLAYTFSGSGNDWAIARLQTNSLGQTAPGLFGFFQLGLFTPSAGETIRITGYGSDDGVTNQTHQTNSGPYVGSSSYPSYQVDTTGGNSGSVVIHEATGMAIGVHTNGGCTSSGSGANFGTFVTNPGFQSAFNANCQVGPPMPPVAQFTADITQLLVTQATHFTDETTGIPTSFAWDFDEDGQIDSTAQHPSFSYSVPGTYDVTLAVSNALGNDSITLQDYITVTPVTPVPLPYTQDFNSGLPQDGSWLLSSTNGFGSISAGTNGAPSPLSGGNGLLMASTTDGNYVTNVATVFFELPPAALFLRYAIKGFSDEDDPEDGLFLSDGTTEVLLVPHHGLSGSWTIIGVDLQVAAAQSGFAPGTLLQLTFRQRDNFTIPTDGHAIDDVRLTVPSTLTATPTTLSGSAGGTVQFGLTPGPAHASATYVLLTTLSGSTPGFNFTGFHVPLNPDGWTTFALQQPNLPPFSGFIGTLDGQGHASAQFSLPPFLGASLIGSTLAQVGVVVSGSNQIQAVTNVASFSITP